MPEAGSISYTRVREIMLKKFEQLGINTQQLGLQNFRAGGVPLQQQMLVCQRGYVRDMDDGNRSQLRMGIFKIRLQRGYVFLKTYVFRPAL